MLLDDARKVGKSSFVIEEKPVVKFEPIISNKEQDKVIDYSFSNKEQSDSISDRQKKSDPQKRHPVCPFQFLQLSQKGSIDEEVKNLVSDAISPSVSGNSHIDDHKNQ